MASARALASGAWSYAAPPPVAASLSATTPCVIIHTEPRSRRQARPGDQRVLVGRLSQPHSAARLPQPVHPCTSLSIAGHVVAASLLQSTPASRAAATTVARSPPPTTRRWSRSGSGWRRWRQPGHATAPPPSRCNGTTELYEKCRRRQRRRERLRRTRDGRRRSCCQTRRRRRPPGWSTRCAMSRRE